MIIRVIKDKENPYVMINKELLNDVKISWKAKGILCYLLSLPDDWKFYLADLKNRSSDGISSTSSALKELEKAGYLKRKRKYEKGRIIGIEYIIHEKPYKILKSENLIQEEQPLLINNITNNNLTNICGENTPPNVSKSDTLKEKPDTTLFNDILKWFFNNNPDFEMNKKRGGIIKNIEKRCNGKGIGQFLLVSEKFIRLKQTAPWWEEQPIIPETIMGLWERILEAKIKIDTRKSSLDELEELYG